MQLLQTPKYDEDLRLAQKRKKSLPELAGTSQQYQLAHKQDLAMRKYFDVTNQTGGFLQSALRSSPVPELRNTQIVTNRGGSIGGGLPPLHFKETTPKFKQTVPDWTGEDIGNGEQARKLNEKHALSGNFLEPIGQQVLRNFQC